MVMNPQAYANERHQFCIFTYIKHCKLTGFEMLFSKTSTILHRCKEESLLQWLQQSVGLKDIRDKV